jgi:hypothetical protein
MSGIEYYHERVVDSILLRCTASHGLETYLKNFKNHQQTINGNGNKQHQHGNNNNHHNKFPIPKPINTQAMPPKDSFATVVSSLPSSASASATTTPSAASMTSSKHTSPTSCSLSSFSCDSMPTFPVSKSLENVSFLNDNLSSSPSSSSTSSFNLGSGRTSMFSFSEDNNNNNKMNNNNLESTYNYHNNNNTHLDSVFPASLRGSNNMNNNNNNNSNCNGMNSFSFLNCSLPILGEELLQPSHIDLSKNYFNSNQDLYRF